MRRVVIVGCSGSGKSTLARALAERLGVGYIELDAIFHQPGWTELPTEQFRATVSALIAADGWVVDGNYSHVLDLVQAAADTVVFVDPPRWRVMLQLTRRTTVRLIRREELWNGNREQVRNVLSRDENRSILLWAWRRHAVYRERYADVALRLASRAEMAAFLTNAG